MISYKDIKEAINIQLKKTGIAVNSNDIKEGFKRPSFFVQIDNTVRSSTEIEEHKAMSIYIYYFPTDNKKHNIELLEMQETLENLFDLKLKVKERLLNIIEVKTGVTDGVFNFSFELDFWSLKDSYIEEQENTEKMEILTINIEQE